VDTPSVRPDEAENAAQSIEGLEHRGNQRGVAAVTWKNRADSSLEPGNQIFRFLALLIGHSLFLPQSLRTVNRTGAKKVWNELRK
jgi:hypothetical protein